MCMLLQADDQLGSQMQANRFLGGGGHHLEHPTYNTIYNVVPLWQRDQLLTHFMRTPMSHVHQEDRNRFITEVMEPSRMIWTKRETSGFGFYCDWGLGLRWGYHGICRVWTCPPAAEPFFMGLPRYRARGREGGMGFESSQGSNIKNEVRLFIIVCSS